MCWALEEAAQSVPSGLGSGRRPSGPRVLGRPQGQSGCLGSSHAPFPRPAPGSVRFRQILVVRVAPVWGTGVLGPRTQSAEGREGGEAGQPLFDLLMAEWQSACLLLRASAPTLSSTRPAPSPHPSLSGACPSSRSLWTHFAPTPGCEFPGGAILSRTTRGPPAPAQNQHGEGTERS